MRARLGSVIAALLAAVASAGCSAEPSLLPAAGLSPPRNQIVFLGDSLSAGHGLSREQAFPAVVGRYWTDHGVSLEAVNAGVSGDTTLDVRGRLDSAVGPRTYLVFLEIGTNDAFRGRDPRAIEETLASIVAALQHRHIKVVLAEMWLPMQATGGANYRERFDAMYGSVGRRFGVPVMRGFLRSLVDRPRLWQSDGLHPTAEGDRILARDILIFLNPSWRLLPAR